MSSSFLSRLPAVALANVFKQLELSELINLCGTSKKFAAHIRWFTNRIAIDLKITPASPNNRVVLTRSGPFMERLTWKNVEILDVLARSFNVKTAVFELNSGLVPCVKALERAQSVGLQMSTVRWRINCDSENAAKVLKLCSSATGLDFQCSGLRNMDSVNFQELSMTRLSLFNAEWVTFDQICAMRNIRNLGVFCLRKLTDADFNRLVKMWIACEVQFQSAELRVKEGMEINMGAVMEGIQVLERPNASSYKVQRSDGTHGTIKLENDERPNASKTLRLIVIGRSS